MKNLILASNSPRRRELLAMLHIPFEVCPADLDESPQHGESPEKYVQRLACQKASAIALIKPGVIVAADTIVVDRGQLLGKPVDANDACKILKQLRGRMHQVFTGIAILDTETNQLLEHICCTDVPMRDYSDREIDAYIATGDPMDKAGAYAIQHIGFHPVDHLIGCLASVMGMPLCHLIVALRKLGIEVRPDIPERCQQHLNYNCQISAQILDQE